MFGDPEHFPWTMGSNPNYQTEAHIYAKHILQTKPDAKIGVLYQNDDFGKDYPDRTSRRPWRRSCRR